MPSKTNITGKRAALIHVLCWSIVLFLPLFFYNSSDAPWQVTRHHFMRSLGAPLCYMLLFYLNYLWLVPKFYFRDHKAAFYAINVVAVVVAMLLMTGWWHMMNELFTIDGMTSHGSHARGPRPPRYPMFFYNAIMLILVAGLALAVRMSQRWQHLEEARKEAEKNRTEAELSNLRNQLNPHFLLNTLNNIYALIAFDSDKAQTAVEELSKLLRHVLYDNQQNFVPLYKEVAFMQNYIELMRIRLTDQVQVTTHIDVEPDDSTPIAPLIFISLLENAFKHGISQAGKGFIDMTLSQHQGTVTCQITNSNHPKRQNDKSGSGIGLEQVSKRLELMYPGHYTWEKGVSADGTEYFSKIVIHHDH